MHGKGVGRKPKVTETRKYLDRVEHTQVQEFKDGQRCCVIKNNRRMDETVG